MTDETYEGWTNRETWAAALHINNDQGWQESVHEALREACAEDDTWDQVSRDANAHIAGRLIRENVESVLTPFETADRFSNLRVTREQWLALQDIGSLWRVNWTELGASFLEDVQETSS